MWQQFRISVLLLAVMTALTGVIYPCVVMVFAQIVFPYRATGSLLVANGKAMGSELIGQEFHDPANFWGRLSATQPTACNAAASSGSNWGPLNPNLPAAVRQRVAALRALDPRRDPVPVDLATASASGLDPHISPAAAEFQVARVARLRGLPIETVRDVVRQCTEHRTWGFLGEPRVNVLRANLALQAIRGGRTFEPTL